MIITVDLPGRAYDVVVEPEARRRLAELRRDRVRDAQIVAIVASESVQAQPWFDLDPGGPHSVVTIPDGEDAKTLATVESLCRRFSDLGLSRRDLVVSVGGGATTDLVGFAAAVYLRGVAVVHVATSLLAQVDAALGGKTGVNLPEGKNLVGAFHQPVGVLCDLSTLATLPAAERRSGLGEVAKCWLLEARGVDELRRRSDEDRIAAAIALKAAVVATDERESGPRALLNYGHTLGHALEAQRLSGHLAELRHGEAVAIGLAFAVRLAQRLGRVGEDAVAEHDAVLAELGLPARRPRHVSTDEVVAAMGRDKKAHHQLTFVLGGPSGYEVVAGIDESLVREVYDTMEVE